MALNRNSGQGELLGLRLRVEGLGSLKGGFRKGLYEACRGVLNAI